MRDGTPEHLPTPDGENPNASAPYRVVIADDAEVVRDGVKYMLENRAEHFEVVGVASDGREAIDMILELQPDLAILDLRMPRRTGIEAIREINAKQPEIPILILTSHAKPEYLYDAVLAGAAGYILKEASSDDLMAQIQRVLDGEPVLDASIVREYMLMAQKDEQTVVHTTMTENREEMAMLEEMSEREAEVLGLAALGHSNDRIAQLMFISPHTVKNHMQAILKKLKASDRTQAAVKAVKLGLLPDVEEAAETA